MQRPSILTPRALSRADAVADIEAVPDGVAERRSHVLNATSEWQHAISALLSGAQQPAVHLQPIVDLHRGTIAGYESLARFAGPPSAPPDRWFLEASRHGVAVELERDVLTLALRNLAVLPPATFLSINVSPAFLASPAWHRLIATHARLDRLVIELTEHSAVEHFHVAQTAIKSARQRGALLAVDDTGAGYASLQQVMRLRPDFVKLDRGFIAHCDRDSARAAMIEAVAAVAARIDAWVVAEGVETQAELQCLMRLGVPLAQGWLLGRPAPTMTDVPASALEVITSRRQRASDAAAAAAILDAWPNLAQKGGPLVLPQKLTLVLDADQRPVSWTGPGASRASRPLTARTHTPLRALAKRAMARAEASRFLPVVCVDDDGRYLGVVRIEQIVAWLTSR